MVVAPSLAPFAETLKGRCGLFLFNFFSRSIFVKVSGLFFDECSVCFEYVLLFSLNKNIGI